MLNIFGPCLPLPYVVAYVAISGLVAVYAGYKPIGFSSGFMFSIILTPVIGFLISMLYKSEFKNIE